MNNLAFKNHLMDGGGLFHFLVIRFRHIEIRLILVYFLINPIDVFADSGGYWIKLRRVAFDIPETDNAL